MNRRYHWSVLLAGVAVLMALALVGDGRLWGQATETESISIAGGESFVYLLELQGQPMGEYAECSGLGSRHKVEQQAAVTPRGTIVVQATPGALQWERITLKRSTPSSAAVWQWRKLMEDVGVAAALRDGRITLYQAGSTQPLAQWSFSRAWPAALVFNGSEEELVIVHEGLTLGTTTSGGTGTSRATR